MVVRLSALRTGFVGYGPMNKEAGAHQEKENEVDLNLPGRKVLED
jgi:hypothetical protein